MLLHLSSLVPLLVALGSTCLGLLWIHVAGCCDTCLHLLLCLSPCLYALCRMILYLSPCLPLSWSRPTLDKLGRVILHVSSTCLPCRFTCLPSCLTSQVHGGLKAFNIFSKQSVITPHVRTTQHIFSRFTYALFSSELPVLTLSRLSQVLQVLSR